MTSEFARHLEAHRAALVADIERIQDEIASRSAQLRQLQLKLESVLELMKAEGVAPAESHRHFLEVAHDTILSSGPRHYLELTTELRKLGVIIPGTRPEANLLAHMSRDQRFRKVGRGTYAVRTGPTAGANGRGKTNGTKKKSVGGDEGGAGK